ncbi:hypothetical protein [Brochothrix thermosphacta]|uniref:hypothetical protein n=1 Tax=Brochothrix thermosphacta TaxID=2756 RepID=UPI001146870E|nr:hypothetical protein [Brochothrix thermosphacta]
MSAITSNNIANSSGITDKNISFSKTWCEKQVIKGFSSICYYGTLTYTPSRCSNCGFTSENMARNYPALRLLNQRICLPIYF